VYFVFEGSSIGSAYEWHTLNVGAGGYVTGIDIAADGTKVIRTDTYGAWRYNTLTERWQQLLTIKSMPADNSKIGFNEGVYEIAIAPSNTQRFYMIFNGYVYRSDNRGLSWARTAFSKISGADPNNAYRAFGKKLAVDPTNADVVYAATASGGVFVSSDAGASWIHISAIAASSAIAGVYPGHAIAFDANSRIVNGKTQGIYVASYGTGVYHSTDGGSTWAVTKGAPTTFRHMIVDQNGIVWLVDNIDNGNLQKYVNGRWSSISGAGANCWSVAVDPRNATHIVVGTMGGELVLSTNAGSTWVGPTKIYRSARDIPWLAWTNEHYMTNGDMQFDPSESNLLYFAEGIGVWYTSPPSNNTIVTWNSKSAGIEQLVANWIISPPGGVPLVTAWDRPIFRITDPSVYPSRHGLDNTTPLVMGWSADWASTAPSTIVVLANWYGPVDTSGYSTDGGQTWSTFRTRIPNLGAGAGIGGSIAASTPANFVVVGTDNGTSANQPYYTDDGGLTWNALSIPGVPASGETGWGFAYYLDRQILAADRVTANTFYIYNYGPRVSPSAAGVYKSTDGGATWSHVYARPIDGRSGYNAQLRSVPGQAGHLFFTSGDQSGSHPASQRFYRSTDGGATWKAIANVNEVWSFGFGKAAPGKTYATVFIYGWVNRTLGVWRSDDQCVTWTQISDGFPTGSFDHVKVVEGDANTYGTIYVGFAGSGYAYGQPAVK
jgi:photosystem II stability/assembly factor-like uncharacterized protein